MTNTEWNQSPEPEAPHEDGSSPHRRASRRLGAKTAVAGVAVVVVSALAPPGWAMLQGPTPGYDVAASAVVLSYRCSSSVAETDETYTFVAAVPAEVEQGTEFSLSDVVITGTPSVDLLLVSLDVGLVAPIGATSIDGLSRTFLGPGSQDPPGPVAPAGTPNSSPPMSFRFVASGAVGTTIDFHTGTVSSVVADIADPSLTVPVTCARTGGGAIASTTIVAPAPPPPPTEESTTTTTQSGTAAQSGSTPETSSASVLGTQQSRTTTPVAANPAFTG